MRRALLLLMERSALQHVTGVFGDWLELRLRFQNSKFVSTWAIKAQCTCKVVF